jgi:class 3 adenylate cyclase
LKQTRYILLFILCLLFITSGAQQNNYIVTARQFSVEDGLASREVLCGLQDEHGFIWFGTRNGLNRYDGENFLLFTQQHNHMQDSKILALATDYNNHLFIQYGLTGFSRKPNGKIDVMDLTTHEVKPLTEVFPAMPFKESDIYLIANDGTDNLIFLTTYPYKLWHYSAKKGFTLRYEMKDWPKSTDHFPLSWGGFDQGNASLFYLAGNVSYFITPDTVYKVLSNSDTNIVGSFTLVNGAFHLVFRTLKDQAIYSGIVTKSGKIERINSIEPFIYNETSNTNSTLEFTNMDPSIITKMNTGIYIYDGNGATRLIDAEKVKGYNNMMINKSFLDREGKRWICASNCVLELKIEKQHFHSYFTKAQLNISEETQARGIYSDDTGKIYANIWNHLYVSTSGIIKPIETKDIVYALLKHDGVFYLGCQHLIRYNDTDQLLRFDNTGNTQEIWSIFPMNDSILLLGRTSSICLFNIRNGQTTIISVSPETPKPSFVYRFIKSTDGNIWACAENGLFVLNEKGAITAYYGDTKDEAHKLPYSKLYDINEDAQGILWLATNGEGLYRWDRNKNEFRQFIIANGLPSNVLYRIENDNSGNLWISSDYGLIHFNTKDFSVRTFTIDNGISHNEFNRISSFKAADGRMFFGGLDGVNAFYPKDLMSDTVTNDIPLCITSFGKFSARKDSIVNLTSDILQKNKIAIEPGDRFIELKFMLLDFEPGKKRYAYKIDGLDKDWNYIDENSIHISGLPYGNYVLHVKGQNASGAWSKNELTIAVNVIPPFYRSAWFILLCIAATGLGIYLIIYFRTKKLHSEKKHLEEVVLERTAEVLKEKKKSDELLLNILPEEVADELKETGSAKAKHFEMVTVMFTDFQGFTLIGEQLSPEKLVAEINHCFIAYDNIIHKYEIEKIKTIGDAYLAVCGLPQQDAAHAEKVVKACLDIIKFMNEYRLERMKNNLPYFDVRIGINSGPVVAGIVGVKKFAYDIWGDTVNTAARMEEHSLPGRINISGTTYALVKDRFTCQYRGKISAKNKGEIDMYFVEG